MITLKTPPQIAFSTSWAEIGLLSLTVVFGMQLLRTFPRVIFFTFRWMPGVSHVDMVLLAFGAFLISFLCAILCGLLGLRVALTLTAGVVGVATLVEPLSNWPTLSVIAVTSGVGGFVLFLPIYLGHLRGRGVHGMARFGIGLLLGLTLDSALRGVWESWLLSAQLERLLSLTTLLMLLLFICLVRLVRALSGAASPPFFSDFAGQLCHSERSEESLIWPVQILRFAQNDKWGAGLPHIARHASVARHPAARENLKEPESFWRTFPVLALGPFLLTQVLLYQNIAYLTVLSQWQRPTVLVWVLLMNLLGLAGAVFVINHVRRSWWLATLLVVSGSTLVPLVARLGGLPAIIAITLGYMGMSTMFALICISLATHATQSSLWPIAIINGFGMFLFIFLLFILSVVVLPAPYNDGVSFPVQLATLIMGICALAALRGLPNTRGDAFAGTPKIAPTLLFCLLLLAVSLSSPPPDLGPHPFSSNRGGLGGARAAKTRFPVRVMTYNLHFGLNSSGQLSLEEQARVIEESEADIIGVQEVGRGFYLSGSFDTLVWLSERLNMPYVYGPTEILATGNGILSRYPIREWGSSDLLVSGEERVQARGYLWAKVEVAKGQEWLVMVAHLHSSGHHASPARRQQVTKILENWPKEQPTLIMGDMNAFPDMPEMALFRAAGLKDAFVEAGVGNGYTFPATQPTGRIDYIWHSPDLSATQLLIPPQTASDHLPVVATLQATNPP